MQRDGTQDEDHEADGSCPMCGAANERLCVGPPATACFLTLARRSGWVPASSPVSGTGLSDRICEACGEHLERELRKHDDYPVSGTSMPGSRR